MSSEIKVDTISENTSANGVTIDSVNIKDGAVGATGTATSVAGIPFYSAATSSIYTHDVSGTDNGANYNTAYGIGALDAVTTGDTNVAIGYNAGTAVQDGEANTIIGNQAGQAVTSPAHNTLIGYVAGGALTTGATNVAIGSTALDGCDTESNNLAIGFAALGGAVAGGEKNVAVGNYSLDALTSADGCTMLGHNAGTGITTGNNNTFLGYQAGDANQTGTGNILIGADSSANTTGGSYRYVLGTNQHSTGDNDFTVGDGSNWSYISFGDTAFTSSSDERLKEEITTSTAGVSFINDLRPVTFKWKKRNEIDSDIPFHYDADSDERLRNEFTNHGFIAQEVKSAIDSHPEIKEGFKGWADPDGIQSVSDGAFIPMLVKAVQELSAEVTTLKQEINTLKEGK